MHKYRFVELLCIILAVLFIISSEISVKNVDMSADDICFAIEFTSDESLEKRNNLYIKDKLSLDFSENVDFVYYSSDDVMNVNEILIAVVADDSTEEIKAALENYLSEKFNLFNGYAPEQAALLDSARIEIISNLVFFCVSADADKYFSAVQQLL